MKISAFGLKVQDVPTSQSLHLVHNFVWIDPYKFIKALIIEVIKSKIFYKNKTISDRRMAFFPICWLLFAFWFPAGFSNFTVTCSTVHDLLYFTIQSTSPTKLSLHSSSQNLYLSRFEIKKAKLYNTLLMSLCMSMSGSLRSIEECEKG